MPDLDEVCFRGSGDLPVDIAGKLITAGIGDICQSSSCNVPLTLITVILYCALAKLRLLVC
jgi:hypothetical protein